MAKIRVLLLFGGRSAEHEVSVISARSIFRVIDRERYDIILTGITRDGRWILCGDDGEALAMDTVSDCSLPVVRLGAGRQHLVTIEGKSIADTDFDIVFPLLHGPYGEDGSIQGLLEVAGTAYVGAGVAASAVGLDKELSRAVFAAAGLPQTEYTVVQRQSWRVAPRAEVKKLEQIYSFPVFVKPANLGSSIGITKAHNLDQLVSALTIAAQYDTKMIVEAAVEGAREIECAVLGNENPKVSGVGEIITGAEFYDYTAKYIDDQSQILIPADLSQATVTAVRDMSATAFRAIDCSGLARVDFLMRENDELLINEINTMPGFTPISMYPKLWEARGLEYPKLIDSLIRLGLARHSDRRDLKITV